MNHNTLILDRSEAFLTQTPDHSIDMRFAESQHICHQLLRQRHCIGKIISKTNRAQPYQQLQEKMSEPLIRRSAAKVYKVLTVDSCFTRRSPEQCGTQSWEAREQAEQAVLVGFVW